MTTPRPLPGRAEYDGAATHLANLESLLIAMRQRRMDDGQHEQYARIVRDAQRDLLRRPWQDWTITEYRPPRLPYGAVGALHDLGCAMPRVCSCHAVPVWVR